MSSGGMDLAVLILLLTGLMSGGQDGAGDGFAYDAILNNNNLTLSVESMTEVLVGPSEERIGKLIEQLASEDFDTREAAYKAIVNLGPSAIPKLKAKMRTTQDIDVRMRCKKAIEEMGLNKGRYLQIRRAALAGLAELGAKEKTELVAKYLDDEDAAVRSEAAKALAKLGGEKALAILADRIKAAAKAGKIKTPEILISYLPHASKEELTKMKVFLGSASHKVDLCLLRAYSERMELAEWLEAVRRYVVVANNTPPRFVRDFLIDVYDLKNDPRYNWLALDETFPWTKFCKKGGTLRKITDAEVTALRKAFAAGLAGADRVFLTRECLRAVPASAVFVAGADIEQLHRLDVMQDFIKYVGDDPIMSFALQKAIESSGGFRTDCVVFYFDFQGFRGNDIDSGFIAHGKYDSVRQTEAFAAMLGWEKRTYNGVTYLCANNEESYGPELGSICFYNDQYVLVGLESRRSSTMETMLEKLMATGASSILSDKEAMSMLDTKTLSAGAWAMMRPGNLGQIYMSMMRSYRDNDDKELDIDEMGQMALFGNRNAVLRMTFDGDGLAVNVRAQYSDADYAKMIHGFFDKFRDLGLKGMEGAMKATNNPNVLAPMRMVYEALKGAKYTLDGNTIEIEAKINFAQSREVIRELFLPMLSAQMSGAMRKMFSKEQRLAAQKKAAAAEIKYIQKAAAAVKAKQKELANEETELSKQPDSAKKTERLEEIKNEKLKLDDELKDIQKQIQYINEKMKRAEEEIEEETEEEEAEEEEYKDAPAKGGGFSDPTIEPKADAPAEPKEEEIPEGADEPSDPSESTPPSSGEGEQGSDEKDEDTKSDEAPAEPQEEPASVKPEG